MLKKTNFPRLTPHLDPWSMMVLVITFALFVIALFVKGLTHDLMLEAGVFLVSVKLIIMAFNNSMQAKELAQKLERIQAALERVASSTEKTPKPKDFQG
jgi:ABC-type multidrug transport system fused ATPase/permease subunit